MDYNIETIEGIGETYAAKLKELEISTTEKLLENGSTPTGRKTLAEKTGIDSKRIMTWVNHADLMRIKGIGGEFAELLEAAGVDTVKELKQRRPDSLATKMAEINEEKALTRALPSESICADWIEQAKELPGRVEY